MGRERSPPRDLPPASHLSRLVTVAPATIEELDSDQAIDTWLAAVVGDYVHAVGTCRMGRPDDDGAVVDLNCAVRGYQALRVVDASVMPDLPKCNTNLTTIAIAEHFVERLRS